MKKLILRYCKFLISILLISAMTLPSYAALSASDGSAFVTKAEFDSALSDFNSRLTSFEAGINSKIDSQVTTYLDRNGIWSAKKQEVVGKLLTGECFSLQDFGLTVDQSSRTLNYSYPYAVGSSFYVVGGTTPARTNWGATFPSGTRSKEVVVTAIQEINKSGLLTGFTAHRMSANQLNDTTTSTSQGWYLTWNNNRLTYEPGKRIEHLDDSYVSGGNYYGLCINSSDSNNASGYYQHGLNIEGIYERVNSAGTSLAWRKLYQDINMALPWRKYETTTSYNRDINAYFNDATYVDFIQFFVSKGDKIQYTLRLSKHGRNSYNSAYYIMGGGSATGKPIVFVTLLENVNVY